jgi:hypothetical protein
MYILTSQYVHNRSEDLGKSTGGLSARSAVRVSELRSQKEGACDAWSRAHPTQKEKAPMPYGRMHERWSVLRMAGCHWTQ